MPTLPDDSVVLQWGERIGQGGDGGGGGGGGAVAAHFALQGKMWHTLTLPSGCTVAFVKSLPGGPAGVNGIDLPGAVDGQSLAIQYDFSLSQAQAGAPYPQAPPESERVWVAAHWAEIVPELEVRMGTPWVDPAPATALWGGYGSLGENGEAGVQARFTYKADWPGWFYTSMKP